MWMRRVDGGSRDRIDKPESKSMFISFFLSFRRRRRRRSFWFVGSLARTRDDPSLRPSFPLSLSVRHSPTRAAALSSPFGARPASSSPTSAATAAVTALPTLPYLLSHSHRCLSLGNVGDPRPTTVRSPDHRDGWLRLANNKEV